MLWEVEPITETRLYTIKTKNAITGQNRRANANKNVNRQNDLTIT